MSSASVKDVAIFLYSKYSKRCQVFLRELEKLSANVFDFPVTLHMLCIDNESVRQCLIDDTQGYKIEHVPCILTFTPTGHLEKHEGLDANTWLQKLIASIPPSPEPPIVDPQSVGDSTPSSSFAEKTFTPSPSLSVEMTTPPTVGTTAGTDQVVTRKKENILSVAASMAKQREMEEERVNPNPYAKAHEAQQKIQESAKERVS